MSIYISDERARKIARNAYGKYQSISVDEPVVVLVAGQMGAGKSELKESEKLSFDKRGGSVSIDLDEFRDFVSTTADAESTQEGARKIIDHLRQMAVQDRKNIVEEGTLKIPS